MLFILDGSNSMWGQIEGQAKITAAQGVLSNLLTDLPADTKVGLMVYGHRDKSSCDDIELVSAIGADTPDALAGKLKNLQPKGKTPIAGALNAAIKAFDRLEGQNNHVVLVSDGIETCEGTPAPPPGRWPRRTSRRGSTWSASMSGRRSARNSNAYLRPAMANTLAPPTPTS